MLHTHLKQGFRLNRTIGFALVAYEVCLLLSVLSATPESGQITLWLRLGLMVALTTGYLLMNEVSLRAFKRHPRLDSLTLEKLSLVLPLTSCGVIAVTYLLSGQLGILLFATVGLLQAQLFGHNGLSRLILALFLMVYCVSLPLGYPAILGFADQTLPTLPASLRILLMLLPFIATLSHYGSIVASLVRVTSSRVSKLQSLAATDALTGLINRRQFNSQLDAEMARAKRYRHPLSLALFDIDDFKKINDFYGHTTGDRILKELGYLISQNVRESDTPARYGGEEFALILPQTGQIDAYEILERLRAMIERTVFCLPDNPLTVTISVGVAQMDPEHPKSYDIIEKADIALYEAKRQGKNRVVYGVLAAPKVSYPPFSS